MKSEDFECLKKTVRDAVRKKNPAALADPRVASLVAAMLDHYEAVIRGEEFWGERGPLLTDEVLALRPLELFARIVVNGGALTDAHLDDLRAALDSLDKTRAKQAKDAGWKP